MYLGHFLATFAEQHRQPVCWVVTHADTSTPWPVGVCSNRLIPPVLHEWREPRHDAFPELRFAAELRNPQHLEILRRVHEFLATGGAQRCHVPIKERSVELSGDEKKIDALRGGALLRAGRLTLDLLRCFQVSPPLVWEAGPNPEPRPVIIVENHCTYHSFTRWNKASGAWAAVCYGSGDCFQTSAPSLAGVVQGIPWNGSLLYFGDLDPQGLLIPLRACQALADTGLPNLQPATAFYELLIKRAEAMTLPVNSPLSLLMESAAWLGSELASQVSSCFAKGLRLPQELVGFEQLGTFGASG